MGIILSPLQGGRKAFSKNQIMIPYTSDLLLIIIIDYITQLLWNIFHNSSFFFSYSPLILSILTG